MMKNLVHQPSRYTTNHHLLNGTGARATPEQTLVLQEWVDATEFKALKLASWYTGGCATCSQVYYGTAGIYLNPRTHQWTGFTLPIVLEGITDDGEEVDWGTHN